MNGLRVRYDDGTAVDRSGTVLTARALRVGQSVVVEAQGLQTDLRASRVSLAPAVAGPVTAASDGRIAVMGQAIELAPGYQGDAQAIERGRFVTVYGLRDPRGIVRATRVDVGSGGEAASVAGVVRALEPGRWAVGSTPIRAGSDPGTGSFVRVDGRWEGGALVATRVESPLAKPGLERVSVEAVVYEVPSRDLVTTGVVPIDLSRLPEVSGAMAAGVRIWAVGSLGEQGAVLADSVEIEPEGGGEPFPLDLVEELGPDSSDEVDGPEDDPADDLDDDFDEDFEDGVEDDFDDDVGGDDFEDDDFDDDDLDDDDDD